MGAIQATHFTFMDPPRKCWLLSINLRPSVVDTKFLLWISSGYWIKASGFWIWKEKYSQKSTSAMSKMYKKLVSVNLYFWLEGIFWQKILTKGVEIVIFAKLINGNNYIIVFKENLVRFKFFFAGAFFWNQQTASRS